ncbi:protein PLASTID TRANSCRIPTIONALLY ACTIVE 10 isoform X1 [Elaeis guineensis]|uniref:protein plastid TRANSCRIPTIONALLY active 10 isoform X1 n=1 Tax=Elaeis guineensis var. tenera TaxID=51953 RepID=A0A6I9RJ93_ELAGV|nr:protein PLASTID TRANSCRIPTIONALLY ACTIVE 10 isoform X1 [Elaeis guineensis]XP_010927646.1 protein PLASTID TRANSCRIPTIONALLY ACTIVE 10 isoform X1 [Elaeis guineensis]
MHCFQLHHRSHHVLPSLRPFPPPAPLRRPKTLIPPSPRNQIIPLLLPSWRRSPLPFLARSSSPYAPDELPIGDDDDDAAYLERFRPREKESEDEARRRNWIERGWAPWEEILTPEADFARKSLNEGVEVPLQSPEAVEAFKMLRPSYLRKKMEESGLSEEEYLAKQFAIKGEIPDPLETSWAGPVAVRMVPPRDWPPRDWQVDAAELEFMREAHKLQAERVDLDEEVSTDVDNMCLERYQVFLKQYREWVAANREKLEEESYKFDQDYYPGRRKRGRDYKDDMLELPFIYPGQICRGKVLTLHLHQGAFVDIGCVYDGWVPIKGNDWYWIRHHIKVGMHVFVEILAKRDPYRFRFPIEMRFLYPNIDHLIFNRFDFPPIFHREEDTNPEQLWQESGRPPIPRKRPAVKMEEQSLLSDHPYVDKLWQLHNAEQMILDHEDENPDKYQDKKYESTIDTAFDEENSVEHTQAYYKKALLPKVILNTNVEELDLDAARAERQLHNRLKKEAKERGEEYKIPKLRRNVEMDEYDLMHWRRSLEEREALIRDISCRKALGLPLEEPGRYVDDKRVWGQDRYDPSDPLYRYDYWGEPKNSEKSKQERMTEDHNQSIVGKGMVWYEMLYEEAIKQKMHREAQTKTTPEETEENEDEDDDIDFDYSIFGSSNSYSTNKPLVNGTESPSMSDEGMFEN